MNTLVSSLLSTAGLPQSSIDHLRLSGSAPLLASSFKVGEAARATIAAAALAANEVGKIRSLDPSFISVDMHDAERECTGHFQIDGVTPNAWAPLSGLYRCKDGHVRIHANFEHHRDGVLRILGLSHDPRLISPENITDALASWSAEDLEEIANQHHLVVSAARSFTTWDETEHAEYLKEQPLFSITRIGDARPLNLPAADGKPLDQIGVLDLTRILAGPVCGRTLAAYGADVMLINSPTLPNIDAIADTSRGKLSAHLDLNRADDNGHLSELTLGAHVFIQGYRPGGLASLGYSPVQVAEIRPGAIYVSLSAYGGSGPWGDRRGFDSLVQTAMGFNLAEAQAAGSSTPKPMPVQILDFASGFLMAFATQAAIVRQQQEGGSWHVEVSLAQTAHWLRSLGRLSDNVEPREVDLKPFLQKYGSGFGSLQAIPHAAKFSNFSADWSRPSNPPGTDQPEWPDRAFS